MYCHPVVSVNEEPPEFQLHFPPPRWSSVRPPLTVIHLLNPVSDYTNYLEEGIATAFSQYAAACYEIFNPPTGHYKDALELVHSLSDDPLGVGRLLRTRVGALSDVSSRDLTRHFPGVSEDIAEFLARKFIH